MYPRTHVRPAFIGGIIIKRRQIISSLLVLACIMGGLIIALPRQQPAGAAPGDWSSYLMGLGRPNFNSAETVINPTSAPNLRLHWSYQAGGYISVQPVEANGLIYWGSWDGKEHATSLDGRQVWQRGLGSIYSRQCYSGAGVASTATVASVVINGILTSVIFVGGGNANFYALNAVSGAIIWQTRLGSSPNHFIWSSPAFYNGSIYIGLSSFGDCPLVQGKVIQMDATTGVIQHTFNVVPSGCTGGGVWGSPTIDPSTSTLYVATGNQGPCSTTEVMTEALVALRAADLSLLSSWALPFSSRIHDSDFGSTPTLFQATIGGVVHQLVGVVNKNGTYYTFDRVSMNNGPLWSVRVANTIGGKCGAVCGDGSISPSAWDGTTLYVAGGQATINGVSCQGSVRALDPSTGTFKWENCLQSGPVVGAVSVVPGVAVVGAGNSLVAIATSDGHTLYTYPDMHSSSNFWGAASIANGVLYIGNTDGLLYAFGT